MLLDLTLLEAGEKQFKLSYTQDNVNEIIRPRMSGDNSIKSLFCNHLTGTFCDAITHDGLLVSHHVAEILYGILKRSLFRVLF